MARGSHSRRRADRRLHGGPTTTMVRVLDSELWPASGLGRSDLLRSTAPVVNWIEFIRPSPDVTPAAPLALTMAPPCPPARVRGPAWWSLTQCTAPELRSMCLDGGRLRRNDFDVTANDAS